MTSPATSPVRAEWLDQREAADGAARAMDLVDALRRRLSGGTLVVHDLGCGTGSMTRWLAPKLPGPQHWILYDLDAALLEVARARTRGLRASNGAAVTIETRNADVTWLSGPDLAGADVVTASALLDILTDLETERLVKSCVAANCPALFTLTVTGRVQLTPSDPLDIVMGVAFNGHQRRSARDGRILGPDAARICAEEFRRTGEEVLVRSSPWRLGRADTELTASWFAGWVDAARQMQPEIASVSDSYVRDRGAALVDGRLRVEVGHDDLLVLPRGEAAPSTTFADGTHLVGSSIEGRRGR